MGQNCLMVILFQPILGKPNRTIKAMEPNEKRNVADNSDGISLWINLPATNVPPHKIATMHKKMLFSHKNT